MDHTTIVSSLRDGLIDFIWVMPSPVTLCLIQFSMILVWMTCFCFMFWLLFPIRSTLGQLLVGFTSFFVSVHLPLPKQVERMKGLFTFEVVTSLLIMVFLPHVLAAFLFPQRGHQIRAARWIQIVVWGLFILQLFRGGAYQ